MWITLRFDPPIDAALGRELVILPGMKFKNGWIACPEHLLDLVRAIAESHGRSIVASAKPVSLTLSRIPLLREWVPKFMTPYQREGVAHALTEWKGSNQSGMLVWAAGSGKTLAATAWACAVGEKHKTIVVTKSAVRFQYRDEIERFTEAPAIVVEGQKPSALPIHGFVVCGYDTLPFWASEIRDWKPDSVVFDESHRVKSRKRFDVVTKGDGDDVSFRLKSNHAAAAFIVSRGARRRLDTTATPIRDRVRDLWAQLDLVRPGEFGSYLGKRPATPEDPKIGFAWRYCNGRDGNFGGVDDSGYSHLDELKSRLRHVTHYVPFSVANRELPPTRRIVTLVRVSEQNRPGAIAQDIKRAARSGQRSAIVEARLWEAASRKRRRIVEIVAQAVEDKQKVCIFTGRRNDCEELEEALKIALDESVPMWMAHGGHADSSRRQIQKDYMAASGPAVLIGTSEAWGEGLDLHDTDLGIVAMLPYTPGQVIQIEGRWVRLGMRRNVLIQYLIAESTIDEHVAQILLRKLPAVERATDIEEVRGIVNQLAGADDETLAKELVAMIGGGV